MWTSLCNFLFDKLFGRSEKKSQSSDDSNDHIYGKRLKLSDNCYDENSLFHQTETPGSDSMQKKNDRESTDEEDECFVIAEMPRRKKPGNSSNELEKLNSMPSEEGLAKKNSSTTFIFKKDDSLDDNELETLNCSNSSLNNGRLSRSDSKPKFFNSSRVFLSQSKMVKSKLSFRKNMRKNINFLQESYRLTEKYQYIQLLQSQTSCNVVPRKSSSHKSICEAEVIPVIDLTSEESGRMSFSQTSSKSAEEEIEILSEVPRVRSFQDMLKIRRIKSTSVIEGLLEKHSKSSPKLINISDDDAVLEEDEQIKKSDPEDLEEKLRTFMQITTLKVIEKKQDKKEIYSLPELNKDEEEKIKAAMKPEPCQEVLVKDFGLSITRRDMNTLLNLNWLNDEVINFYMNLIMERSRQNKNLPKVYVFNTFFYPKLVSNGYASLRRWTKQVDVFSFDLILVPIHLGMHWCMSMIDFRRKSIQYYDSVGSPNDACLDKLLLYLKSESLDKKKKIFPTTSWKKINVEDIPQQMNGSDCGVFSCMFAEHLARECKISFSQDHMPYFRKKMIIEILEKKLLT